MIDIRRVVSMVAMVCAVASVAAAQRYGGNYQVGDAGSMRAFIGMFEPDGSSTYWDDKFADFTGDIADFDDVTFSLDFRKPIGYSSALLFQGGWYEGKSTQAYRDWEDASGRPIGHLTTLTTFELSAAWVFEIGGHDNTVTPYFGVGAGYIWWDLEEHGDFIDFTDDQLPIVRARYTASSGTFAYFAVGGIDVEITPNVSLVAQGRWREADDELGGAFAGFGTLDLSGIEYAGGIALHF